MLDILMPTLKLPEETPLRSGQSGYKLMRDAPLVGTSTLVLENVFEQGEGQITWTEMMKRCEKESPHAGQRHAEKLLICQSVIPEEWRRHHLYFMGTEWQHLGEDNFGQPEDLRLLPYLIWLYEDPPYGPTKARWELWFDGMTCGQERLFSRTDMIVMIGEERR